MEWKRAHSDRGHFRNQLQRRLHLAFGLIFAFPAAGFVWFSIRYRILGDEYVPYFFLGFLSFSYGGLYLLKRLFHRITLISQTIAADEHNCDVSLTFHEFMPKQIAAKIAHGVVSGKPGMEELKHITLVNVDIRGFSSISRQIGPRKTVALLNRFFAATGEIIFRHNGMVDKYLGDGFLAIFGAPLSNPDDADNAIRAAQEMKRGLWHVNRILASELRLAVDMGISVHTGDVLATTIGFERKKDYTVIGDAVNTVFRLQEMAKAYRNGILVSETTLGAARHRPRVRCISVPLEFQRELGGLRVFELLAPEKSNTLAEGNAAG